MIPAPNASLDKMRKLVDEIEGYLQYGAPVDDLQSALDELMAEEGEIQELIDIWNGDV